MSEPTCSQCNASHDPQDCPYKELDEMLDRRPWGEQQEQVDWLESRYDDAYGGDW